MRSSHPIYKTASSVMTGLMLLIAISLVGCQKKVVNANPYAGSQWDRNKAAYQDQLAKNRKDKGLVKELGDGIKDSADNLGEFLFGWTRVFTGEKEPKKYRRSSRKNEHPYAVELDPKSRQSGRTTTDSTKGSSGSSVIVPR